MYEYIELVNRMSERLSAYTYHDIKQMLLDIGDFPKYSLTIGKGSEMERVRPNDDDSPFSTRAALQYMPRDKCKTFGRASSPGNPMFYATVVPDVNETDYDDMRVTATLEVANTLRKYSRIADTTERLTYSRWEVVENIPVIVVCQLDTFGQAGNFTSTFNERYRAELSKLPYDSAQKSYYMTNFIAQEFTKDNILSKCEEYYISAAFAELCMAKGVGGILYPSSRADCKGFNVAIHPDYVDRCLRLKAVREATLQITDDDISILCDTMCWVEDDAVPFELRPTKDVSYPRKDVITTHSINLKFARDEGQQ